MGGLISRDSGEIDTGNGSPTIAPSLDKATFLASSLGKTAEAIDGASYQIEIDPAGLGRYFAVLYFQGEALARVELTKKSEKPLSWETYSKDEELEAQREYERVLTQALGPPPHELAWGTAEAVFDPKGGSSFIVVDYQRRRGGASRKTG